MYAMSLLNRNDAFTIIWKIRNFSMCPEINDFEEAFCSPTLTVDVLDKTDWYLKLLSKDINGDKCLLCGLRIGEDGLDIPLGITINYSIELVSIESSETKSKISHQVFKEKENELLLLGNLDEIYNKKNTLLPSDILTVQCCMWKSGKRESTKITAHQKVDVECAKFKGNEETSSQDKQIQEQKTLISHVYAQNVDKLNLILADQMHVSAEECLKGFTKNLLPNKCVIRSQVELERRTILWAIDKFSEIEIGQKIFMPVLSTVQDTPLILVFYLSGDIEQDCDLRIDIQRDDDSRPVFVKCAITMLNAEREDRECFRDARLLTGTDTWHLTPAKKNKLFDDEDPYLKNGTLFLRCEFDISAYGGDFTVEVIVLYPKINRFADVNYSRAWKKKSLRVLEQGDFCDISLQIGQQSFGAHKIVLCASSTYFRNMFSSDFKEQKVEITNCETGTLEKLLNYMYLGALEEIPLEDLIKLYSAAVKFQIVGLKSLCSFELRDSLEVSNVCDVLNIADLHEDQFLKKAVGKFISEFANEVFHSSKWKNLMECNPKLTGNVMHEVLTNKYAL